MSYDSVNVSYTVQLRYSYSNLWKAKPEVSSAWTEYPGNFTWRKSSTWLHVSLRSFHSQQGSVPDAVSKFSYNIHGLYVAVWDGGHICPYTTQTGSGAAMNVL